MRKREFQKWRKIYMLENKDNSYTEDELSFLYTLSKSKISDFRIKAAELLVDHYTHKSEEILYHMTFDREYLVRLNAVDSLCVGKSLKSLQRLNVLTTEDDYMIRGYAWMSYCDVYINIYDQLEESVLERIKNCVLIEKSNWTRAVLLEILYLYAGKEYLNDLQSLIYKCIESKEYETIWCILNIFDEIIDESNKQILIEHLKKIMLSENLLIAQKEKIENMLCG